MPCWVWVAPLIWCFIPSWLLSAKSWNFIKSGYEILRLRAKCTKLGNIYSYSTHSSSSDWLKEFRKRKDRANSVSAPNLLLNWVSCPLEAQCTFFFLVFWILIPYVTKQGVPVPSFPDFTDNFIVSGHTQLVCSCIHVVPYTQVALHIFFKASPTMVSMWRYWMRFITESNERPPGAWKVTAFRALEKH
jgi:hypothetical protein